MPSIMNHKMVLSMVGAGILLLFALLIESPNAQAAAIRIEDQSASATAQSAAFVARPMTPRRFTTTRPA